MKELDNEGYGDGHVLRTTLLDGIVVSTVDLRKTPLHGTGIDQMIEMMGEVLGVDPAEFPGAHADIAASVANYESMVFTCDEEGITNNWQELACKRYMTEEEAMQGHQELCMAWDTTEGTTNERSEDA